MPEKAKRQQIDETRLIAWYKWEFLRRNHEYRKDYDEFMHQFGKWFDDHGDHGYWYDETIAWSRPVLREFAEAIAPKGRVICERWQIQDPFSPDWDFTKDGVRQYKPDYEVFLPTGCLPESAGKLWDPSSFLPSMEHLEKQLAEFTASQHGPRPELAMTFDLKRPLKVLLREASERIMDRKRRYLRKHL
jgi:hypothetical protein